MGWGISSCRPLYVTCATHVTYNHITSDLSLVCMHNHNYLFYSTVQSVAVGRILVVGMLRIESPGDRRRAPTHNFYRGGAFCLPVFPLHGNNHLQLYIVLPPTIYSAGRGRSSPRPLLRPGGHRIVGARTRPTSIVAPTVLFYGGGDSCRGSGKKAWGRCTGPSDVRAEAAGFSSIT